MGFSEAVQWWEEWQLRVLVLASGFLRFFQFFAGILRQRCIPSCLRFLIWLAYLSSVAIYALATLFNRQKTQEWVSTHPRSARLQVSWAPILLIHLGGLDGISAYNIEDNELWRRHVVTLVSHVAVAVYVSWAGDENILIAGVAAFVGGFHKCVFKPWELKKVSINSLIGSYSASEENSNICSPDQYVRAATENFRDGHGGQQSASDQDDGDIMWEPYYLFVDLAPRYSDRLSCLKATVHKNPVEAHALDFFFPSAIRQWPDQIAQYNLIGYLARNKKHRKSRRLATLLVCKDYIDQLWCMKPSKSSRKITKLVHACIAKGWTQKERVDGASHQGHDHLQGVQRQPGPMDSQSGGLRSSLEWTLELPFDESVLLWHIATDFCFHHLTAAPPSDETAQSCGVMSNYMVYLLFVNPEMLMTGARRFLFREAYRQLKETLKLAPQQPDPDAAGPSRHENESELARKIAQNIQHPSGRQFRFIYDAWRLAQHLQNLGAEQEQDSAKMWRVIQGVWVEMLCFSAGRCRGYLHAKSLGKGGEYLSCIWLLLSYMGMETLAERMQRTKLKEEDARNNGGASNGTTTAASSSCIASGSSTNGTEAEIPVPAAGGGHEDDTTEASITPVTEGGDADGTIPASPVMTTNPGGDGRTSASPVTPSGDDNV